jgi:hypothetical protein
MPERGGTQTPRGCDWNNAALVQIRRDAGRELVNPSADGLTGSWERRPPYPKGACAAPRRGFARIALRSICRTLLPGVGVLIKLPALGIKGACGRYPATKYVLFKIRRPDRRYKAETASVALTSAKRRAQVRQRRSKARVSVEHAAT